MRARRFNARLPHLTAIRHKAEAESITTAKGIRFLKRFYWSCSQLDTGGQSPFDWSSFLHV